MTKENFENFEKITRGPSHNHLWFSFRKGVVTASTSHVFTKMNKLSKRGSGCVDIVSLLIRIYQD